ncbi:MAG: DinB family protein [Gemmatimonadota bacterium]|nr:DinB family protein [Gemmatimonadota bacterium]
MGTLLEVFRTTTNILNISLHGLPDDVARVRTRGSEGPSISWTVGHMPNSRLKILVLLGEVRPNPYADQFGDAPATDGVNYPTLATMLAEWANLHEALELAAVKDADVISRPLAKAGLHGESKVRDRIAFLAWHEAYHVGVIGAARKAAGLLGPAELVRAASRAA